ncbi:MAG: hypothetical protein ABIS86_04270 [Streptosporangiaceae bacterium]
MPRDIPVRGSDGSLRRGSARAWFLSPRMVGYHLDKAYPRLGLVSRANWPP